MTVADLAQHLLNDVQTNEQALRLQGRKCQQRHVMGVRAVGSSCVAGAKIILCEGTGMCSAPAPYNTMPAATNMNENTNAGSDPSKPAQTDRVRLALEAKQPILTCHRDWNMLTQPRSLCEELPSMVGGVSVQAGRQGLTRQVYRCQQQASCMSNI